MTDPAKSVSADSHGSSLRDTQPGAETTVLGWQAMETAPPRDQVIIAMARYQTATAGFPAFVHFVDGAWRMLGRTRFEPMVCWAWMSRDVLGDWPSENSKLGGDEAKRSEPNPSPPPTEQAETGGVGYDSPDFAPMTHAPDLERWAYNQMPKAGWRELRLMRFDGTDLYQWRGKRGVTSEARDWSVFEDAATEVFRIAYRLASPVRGRE